MPQKIFRGLLTLLVLLMSTVAGAQDSELLDPEEAFRLEANTNQEGDLQLNWEIAEGYYMYRERIEARLVGPEGAQLGELELPAGTVKDDPYFGEMEVYYQDFAGRAPIEVVGASPDMMRVEVTYQGCAEAGVCYPPTTTTVELPFSGTGAGVASAPAASGPAGTQPANEQSSIATLITDAGPVWISLTFIGFGLLLAFTPCVLPMVPILSGIIVGSGETGWRRGLILSIAYVLPMAVAYAIFGMIAGLAGQNLQAMLQAPWAIGLFSLIFVLLGMSMLGFFSLQMPAGIQTRLAALSNRQRGGTLIGAGLMGFLSALIVGPCLTAPLAGALLYISQTGDAAIGGLALFSLGIGMGIPLLAIGALGGRFLPSAGVWMDTVKAAFGFVLLGMAIWMLGRVIPEPVSLLLWAALLISIAVGVGTFEPLGENATPFRRLIKSGGYLGIGWAAVLLVGAAAGSGDPLRPLAGLAVGAPAVAQEPALELRPVQSLSRLEAEVAQASQAGKPVLVDFYADWCVSCKVMEKEVFTDPEVRARMEQFALLKPDVTANDQQDRDLMRAYRVIGPPTFLFFDRAGKEIESLRLVGEMNAEQFLTHLDRVLEES